MTPTATPTVDPVIAGYLAKIEARDTGPFPVGTYFCTVPAGSCPLAFTADGRVLFQGTYFGDKFTSTNDLLIATYKDFGCGTLSIFKWWVEGDLTKFETIGSPDNCLGILLPAGPWKLGGR